MNEKKLRRLPKRILSFVLTMAMMLTADAGDERDGLYGFYTKLSYIYSR